MAAMASQITSITIVYSTVYSDTDQKKTSKLRVTGLCEGNSPVTGEFPTQMASNAQKASIWWRHHDFNQSTTFFIDEIAFEKVVCEMAAILSRGRWVKLKVSAMTLGRSHDCFDASETVLKGMDKIDWYQTKTKHNKARTICIYFREHCKSDCGPTEDT